MHEYTILGTPSCPYCTKAKELLERFSIPYEYVDISRDPNLRFQYKAQGYKTVPIVIVDGDIIGGFTELQHFIVRNEPRIRG